MAPYSSILAWRIPWMEEPGGLQSMVLLRVGHDWATSLPLFTFMHWRRKWQPTRVLARRTPGTGEPGGLPSMGWQRVRHDWSDLAAAAAIKLVFQLIQTLCSTSWPSGITTSNFIWIYQIKVVERFHCIHLHTKILHWGDMRAIVYLSDNPLDALILCLLALGVMLIDKTSLRRYLPVKMVCMCKYLIGIPSDKYMKS